MKIYTNDLVKGHSDFKVKCLTFGLYTQVSDSGPLGPLVYYSARIDDFMHIGRIFFIAISARYSLFVLMCRKTHITQLHTIIVPVIKKTMHRTIRVSKGHCLLQVEMVWRRL